MQYVYTTKGTCSRQIIVELEDGVVQSVQFVGGCNGNTKGISSLVAGMKAEDVIRRCQGITCGLKPTSCPDQLARALQEAVAAQGA
ncbi:MAG TPA: TIGR03905 family TSCPD domain-containing protein [Candidatus Caccousia avistercoris]|nr:TIGR03905 family TSCPD domain-containing protein [Candidatus Caccousia avistercoris]